MYLSMSSTDSAASKIMHWRLNGIVLWYKKTQKGESGWPLTQREVCCQYVRITAATKIKVHDAQYTYVHAEIWTVTVDTQRRLRVFQMDCLRRVTRIDHRQNMDIKATLNIEDDVVHKLAIRHIRYFGHICWMDPQRLPYVSLHGRVDGQRGRGRPRKRWLDFIEDNCNKHGLSLEESFHTAEDW